MNPAGPISARKPATRQDDTYIERFLNAGGILIALELHYGHAVGVGKQLLDFCLIGYGFRRLADAELYGALQRLGQLGLILSSHFLKCTLFHESVLS